MMTRLDYENSLYCERQLGIKEGIQEGISEEKLRIAQAMKTDGMSNEVIAKYSGLSVDQIKKL